MSKLEVDAIEPQSGTTLTIGASGDSVTLGSGATIKLDGNYPNGTNNVVLGSGALDDGSLTGGCNVAVGTNALTANTTGNRNVAVGHNTLSVNTTGLQNTAIGEGALCTNSTGNYNTGIGRISLAGNTTASNNTAVGYASLSANTTGANNTAVGYSALSANTTGFSNATIGWESGLAITTGSCNTALGRSAGDTTTTGNNNVSLGYASRASSASVSNEITLGNTASTNLRCNDTSISSLSDERDKENIEDIPFGLDYILALRPVKFDWNRRDGSSQGKKDFGFIAQELDQVEEQFGLREYTRLVHKNNPEKWEADPMKTYPILIKAIQQLKEENEDLKSRIEVLENS